MSQSGFAETVRVHQVQTPEGIALPFVVAPVGERLGALTIDLAIILGSTIAVWLAGILLAAGGARGYGLALAVLVSFLLRSAYFAFCEVNWGGRTVGKRITRLRVIARDGGPLGAGAVLARNLTREVELFLPLTVLLAGPALWPDLAGWQLTLATLWLFVFAFLPLFNADRLRCGDIVAGTLVVRLPDALLLSDLAGPPPALRAVWPGTTLPAAPAAPVAPTAPGPPAAAAPAAPTSRAAPAATASAARPGAVEPRPAGTLGTAGMADAAGTAGIAFAHEQLEIYGIHELQVLEDLLHRSDLGTVDPGLLADVAARIQRKIGWMPGGQQVPVDLFLHAFYRAQRARLEHKLLFGKRQDFKRQS